MANGKIAGLLAVLLGAVAALSIGLVAAQNSGVEVRIEARRLDDGRVEFALRERGGERILPRARYFPAETEAGRWLNASWITVGEGRDFTAAPTPTPTATQERTTPFEGVGRNYATTRDDFTDEINTGIFASIDGKYSWSEDTRLMVLALGDSSTLRCRAITFPSATLTTSTRSSGGWIPIRRYKRFGRVSTTATRVVPDPLPSTTRCVTASP